MKAVNSFFSATAVAILAIFFALSLSSCDQGPPPCPAGSQAVKQYSNVTGRYTWVCQECGCNNPNPNPNPNPQPNPNPDGVTYQFNASAYTRAIITSSAVQSAYAFKQGTTEYVLDNSGNKVTSPKVYVMSINPWNGVNFIPGPNDGQALIYNQGTSQGQGLYNRMVSDINSVAGAVAYSNAVTYLNTGIVNANYYYVIVTIRKNQDGSPAGETVPGVDVLYEITDYEIVTGTSTYFNN